MNIIYLHQYFKKPTMRGGIRSYEFAKRLVRDGHNVKVITSDTENDFNGWKIERYDGIEIHWISIKYNNNFGFLRRVFSFLKFIFFSTAHILRLKSDILIATSTPLSVAVPAIIYKKVKSVPYIFEVRDVWPEVPIALGVLNNKLFIFLASLLETFAYKYATKIIALSPDMKKSIESRNDNVTVVVIPNASDTDLFDFANLPFDCPVFNSLNNIRKKHDKIVFYTGTFGLVNNLEYIIQLSRHSNGDLGFVLVGAGQEQDYLETLSKELGVYEKIVHFHPPIPKSKLYLVHSLFDMSCSTVLPVKELYANSANKIFDAFASGVPIFINHDGWIKDLILQHNCGICLSHSTSIDNFILLHDYLFNDELYNFSKISSARLGKNEFNRENLYQTFKACLESVK